MRISTTPDMPPRRPVRDRWPLSWRLAVGAASGAAATAVMTGWMLATAPRGRQLEQPPQRIVRRAAQRLGVPVRRGDRRLVPVTAVAHLGFGAVGGVGYTALVKRPSLGTGVPYALGIWASSYLGWAPALRLMPAPRDDDRHRQLLTFSAHLVYGAVLALVADHFLSAGAAGRHGAQREGDDGRDLSATAAQIGVGGPALSR